MSPSASTTRSPLLVAAVTIVSMLLGSCLNFPPAQTVSADPVEDRSRSIGDYALEVLELRSEGSFRVFALPTAIPLESAVGRASPDSPAALSQLDNVVSLSENGPRLTDRPIHVALRAVLNDVVLAKTDEGNDKIRKAIADARRVLFDPPDGKIPTEAHGQYLAHQKRITALEAELRDSTNPAAIVQLKGQIAREISRLTDTKEKAAVDNAIKLLGSSSIKDIDSLYADWAHLLDSPFALAESAIRDSLSGGSGWIHVSRTLDLPKDAGLQLVVSGSAGSEVKTSSITGTVFITFSVCRVQFRRPALDHPFLQSNQWKTKSGILLGLPSEHTGLDGTDKARVPNVVLEAVMIRGLEIAGLRKDSATLLHGAAAAAAGGASVSVGGVPLGDRGQMTFLSDGYVSIANPLCVGIVVQRLPQIPNPQPGLTWR